MNVMHFQRKPARNTYSVEGLFETVRSYLPDYISCSVFVSRFESRGFFKRIYNAVEAAFNQKEVNHVTGDVHFLCYFMKKRRTILTILDCVFTFNTRGVKKFILWLFWYYLPLKMVARVTVISESTKAELLQLFNVDPNKIRVIPCCISPLFTYAPKQFPSGCPHILQIGTGANKNLLRLFAALAGIDCKLEIIGHLSDEQRTALKCYEITYSNCWNISAEEMVDKYRMCDIVTFVSVYEGFGMPILEANATGRPVITANILSMPEVAGDAACLVDPFSVDDIRAGVCRILADQGYREQLVQNGLRNVLRYSPESIAGQYAELYREVFHAQ